MSHWTTEVRFICENAAGLVDSTGFNNINSVLDKSWDKVFNFDFPLFDGNYRKALCIKILRHFYTREICEETVGLWKLRLEDRLNMVMPYYNQLYQSELIKINPLYTVNYTKDHSDSGGDVRTVSEKTTGSEVGSGTNSGTRDTTSNESGTNKGTRDTTNSETGTNKGTRDTTNSETGNVTTDTTTTGNESGTTTSEKTSSQTTSGTTSNTINSTVDTTTHVEGSHNETSKQTNVSDKTETLSQRYSDTPQGGLNGISDNNYLTNVTLNNNDISQETKNDVTTNGGDNSTTTGNSTTNQTDSGENSGKVDVSDSGKNTNSSEKSEIGNSIENSSKNGTGKISDDYATTKNDTGKIVDDYATTNSVTDKIVDDYKNTNMRDTTGDRNMNDTITTTRAYIEHVVGSNNRSDSSLLNEYRSTFINIDEMVINELNDLFMNIW